jgi:hypothetical protein
MSYRTFARTHQNGVTVLLVETAANAYLLLRGPQDGVRDVVGPPDAAMAEADRLSHCPQPCACPGWSA